jgi:hypothetical protein
MLAASSPFDEHSSVRRAARGPAPSASGTLAVLAAAELVILCPRARERRRVHAAPQGRQPTEQTTTRSPYWAPETASGQRTRGAGAWVRYGCESTSGPNERLMIEGWLAICDKTAFWPSGDAANPDVEILAALRPGMATVPGALLMAICSPYTDPPRTRPPHRPRTLRSASRRRRGSTPARRRGSSP